MEVKPYHFVVADDDQRTLFIVESALRRAFPSAEISSFTDGISALHHYEQYGADAVVTDQSMIPMNGADLIRAIRNTDQELPIVMISNSPNAEEEGAAAGYSAFLDKGHVTRLSTVLNNLLEKRRHSVG